MARSMPILAANDPAIAVALCLAMAADAMFFITLTGALLVLRAGNAMMFAAHVGQLSKPLALAGGAALLAGSIVLWIGSSHAATARWAVAVAIFLGCGFLTTRCVEYGQLLSHHTIIARIDADHPFTIFDGQLINHAGQRFVMGCSAPLPPDADAHALAPAQIAACSGMNQPRMLALPAEIFEDIPYAPGKNVFYAIWYLFTAAHLVHVLLLMTVMGISLIRPKPVSPALVSCWHYLAVLSVLLFPLLYQN
jgi:heme/copper-type cytochrome/quinol oxidase subunit 3